MAEHICGECAEWHRWDGDYIIADGKDVNKHRCWCEESPYYWQWRAAGDRACRVEVSDG